MEIFRNGGESVKEDEGRGRPPTSTNVEKVDSVRSLVEEDLRLTVSEIAQALEISIGSAHSILHEELGLSKLLARWVPKALRPDQLNLRCELSTVILTKIEANENSFLNELLLLMKHGFISMILKQNNSPNSGFLVDQLVQSSSSLTGQSTRRWRLFSGTRKELC